MTTLTLAELEAAADLDLGSSTWHQIDQRQIDTFAEATGDRQWIHVDPERAAAGPFGGTVAHGYLTLSLIPALLGEIVEVTDRRMAINYGIEKVRFTAPVPVGSRVRLQARIASTEPRAGGLLLRIAVELELDGSERPALVAEVLSLAYGGNR